MTPLFGGGGAATFASFCGCAVVALEASATCVSFFFGSATGFIRKPAAVTVSLCTAGFGLGGGAGVAAAVALADGTVSLFDENRLPKKPVRLGDDASADAT